MCIRDSLDGDAEGVEQQLPAAVDRPLGELQAAHVVLREDDVAVRTGGDEVLAALLAAAHAGVRLHAAAPVYDAGVDQPGEQVDHAGAADADGLGSGDRLDVGGVAVPGDAHALDGAGDGLHAVADLVALEGGPGGAAGDRHATFVGERDLGVGADVDGHGRALLAGELRSGDDGQRVRADEAGDGRRKVHAAVRVHVEACLLY